jgi:putative membrane protein
MRRAVIRSLAAGLLAIMVSAFPAAWLAFAEPAKQAQPAESNELSTRDREFLVTIRFANLWEIPMGDLATERGNSEKVREVGRTLFTDHTQLNVDIEKLAQQFNVDLPDEPSSKTQQWMDEISAVSGDEFDRVFANRLRAAHGTVFGLIAEVRAGTQNDTIREFATAANGIVMKHMTILEGTGHVTANGMFGEASARGMGNPENQLGGSDLALAGILGVFAVGATLGLVRTFSSHGATER